MVMNFAGGLLLDFEIMLALSSFSLGSSLAW